MNYSFFLDETGDHGLTGVDLNFPIFLLAGCLFSDEELAKVDTNIGVLKDEFFSSREVILHSRDIRKCEGHFQILFDLDIKKRFYERLNSIMDKANFTIIGAGVNKEEHIKKYGKGARDPYSISLAFIVERLIFCLDGLKGNKVNIAIEKRGRVEDRMLVEQYNTIYDRGTFYVESYRVKEKVANFSYFGKKDNIVGLQVADLCAYPLARYVLEPRVPYKPFEVIENKMYCDKKGKFEGYGLKNVSIKAKSLLTETLYRLGDTPIPIVSITGKSRVRKTC